MRAVIIAAFVVGVIPFVAGVLYFVGDYRRTGQLYRKKLPWMPIMAVGGVIAVGAVFVGIAVTGGKGFA